MAEYRTKRFNVEARQWYGPECNGWAGVMCGHWGSFGEKPYVTTRDGAAYLTPGDWIVEHKPGDFGVYPAPLFTRFFVELLQCPACKGEGNRGHGDCDCCDGEGTVTEYEAADWLDSQRS